MDHSAADSSGDTCQWYNEYTEYCGDYDDDDFDAREMCCACKLIGKSIKNIFGVPRHNFSDQKWLSHKFTLHMIHCSSKLFMCKWSLRLIV